MIAGLAIESLAIQRGDRLLFAGLDLSLAAGEAVALTGPNGVGKTSLLRAIAGFIRPTAGAITFLGPSGRVEADEARRRGMHVVGHTDGVKPARSGRDELLFQARWLGGTAARALEAATRFGLDPVLELETRKLSAGQRRRLTLCRLISAPRPLWLLDEPLAPLDQASRALFGTIMAEHLARGGVILAAGHDPLPLTTRTAELLR